MIHLVCRESDSLIIAISDRFKTENTTDAVNQTQHNGPYVFHLELRTNDSESSQNIVYKIVSWTLSAKLANKKIIIIVDHKIRPIYLL